MTAGAAGPGDAESVGGTAGAAGALEGAGADFGWPQFAFVGQRGSRHMSKSRRAFLLTVMIGVLHVAHFAPVLITSAICGSGYVVRQSG